MSFRISDATIFDTAVRNTQSSRIELNRLQKQVSAGKRVLSVGDDPTAATQLLGSRRALNRIDQFKSNIDAARSALEPVESTLLSLTDVLTRLSELAISVDIEDVDGRNAVRAEVEQLFDEILSLANTRVNGRFVFAGFATDTPTFSKIGAFVEGVIDASVPPEPYGQYNGDNGVFQIQIGEARIIEANVSGREVFLGSTDGDDTPDGSNVDVFNVIRDFRNRLVDPDGQGPPADVAGDLKAALNQVLGVVGTLGAATNRLDIAKNQLDSLELTLTEQFSKFEGSTPEDQIAAIADLTQSEHTFQASLAVTARVIQPSLLDFLG